MSRQTKVYFKRFTTVWTSRWVHVANERVSTQNSSRGRMYDDEALRRLARDVRTIAIAFHRFFFFRSGTCPCSSLVARTDAFATRRYSVRYAARTASRTTRPVTPGAGTRRSGRSTAPATRYVPVMRCERRWNFGDEKQ